MLDLLLVNNGEEAAELGDNELMVMIFGPPDPESDNDVPVFLDTYVVPHVVKNPSVSIPPGGTLELVVELVDSHPDFGWIPNDPPIPTAAVSPGDLLVERWQANGIGHSLSPEDMPIIVGMLPNGPEKLPEVAGLFKDTAEGETGDALHIRWTWEIQPDASPLTNDTGYFWFFSPDNTEIDGGIEVVDLAWTWEKVDPDLEIGAIYLFSINGEGEENDGMLVTLPQAENNEDKRPPMTIFIWGSKFPKFNQHNETEFDFIQQWSEMVGMESRAGIIAWNEVESRSGPCPTLPTTTPTSQSSAGGQNTPLPTPQPSRTPEPPRKPTDTPRQEKTKEKTPDR